MYKVTLIRYFSILNEEAQEANAIMEFGSEILDILGEMETSAEYCAQIADAANSGNQELLANLLQQIDTSQKEISRMTSQGYDPSAQESGSMNSLTPIHSSYRIWVQLLIPAIYLKKFVTIHRIPT